MNYTVDQVLDALAQVSHPAFGNDIVSLNMVSDISIENKKVNFFIGGVL